jgi:GNAT superfamily N-acetyltransferase
VTVTDLLAAYDAQLRARMPDPLPAGVTVEHDGPLVRRVDRYGGFITYRDLGGLAGAELDALIARQRDHFAALGLEVEWKLHGHDRPADLGARLEAHGFRPQEQETVMVGPIAPIAAALPAPPAGVRLREVADRADLDRIETLEAAVWGEPPAGLAAALADELAADPAALTVVAAEAGDEVVSAGWVRFAEGTSFATLWGGSTLPAWRGRGIYRALVAHRARLADARGFRFFEVDASDDSRPILARLGLAEITTTTPYVYNPQR